MPLQKLFFLLSPYLWIAVLSTLMILVGLAGSRIGTARSCVRNQTQHIAHGLGATLSEDHTLAGLYVLGMLDESKMNQSLVARSQAIPGHGEY